MWFLFYFRRYTWYVFIARVGYRWVKIINCWLETAWIRQLLCFRRWYAEWGPHCLCTSNGRFLHCLFPRGKNARSVALIYCLLWCDPTTRPGCYPLRSWLAPGNPNRTASSNGEGWSWGALKPAWARTSQLGTTKGSGLRFRTVPRKKHYLWSLRFGARTCHGEKGTSSWGR